MKKSYIAIPLLAFLTLISSKTMAAAPVVPEMDGSNAMIALGLAVGVVALLREHRKKK